METQDKKQVLLENKISKMSVTIAPAGVLIAAIALNPQCKSAFFPNETEKISRNFSGRKVESIVEEVAAKYFDDVSIMVKEKDNGGKVIDVSVYVYNDDQLKADKQLRWRRSYMI